MNDDDLIRRGDAMHIVDGWRFLEDDIKAIPAAPTFTAADLEKEVSIQEAAKVILTALERAQIDMEILRMFFNGQPRSALEALSVLPADLDQRVKE